MYSVHLIYNLLCIVTLPVADLRIFQMKGRQPLSLGQKPIILYSFAENCMKTKEIGRGGVRA